jgi:cell wall-associated NlpC family hydrolase
MTARTGLPAVLSRAGITSALTTAAVAGPLLAPGLTPRANAATVEIKALRIAASKKGSPYQWGASGPRRFDCSGLTLYSFKEAGRGLPRTAQQQYAMSTHIGATTRRPGDLVFFHTGSRVYHVGIYGGHGRIWHAPRPGKRVGLERIWTRSVWYGRVN